MELAVIGTGYVGLVAGAGFADAGHTVYCVDKDTAKIEGLKQGRVPIYEPGLEDLIERNKSRMFYTTNLTEALEQAEVIFVAVGTPELPDGSADLGPVFEVTKQVCELSRSQKFLVLKSTVPVGTARRVKGLIREFAKTQIEVVSNPEFLREGAAIEDFLSPDRVVIGTLNEQARTAMAELYRPFTTQLGRPLLFMDNASAELTKYAANAFLSVKISFINELSLLADKMGADIDQVRVGFSSDHRINPAFFSPGIGFGGSCFPKDVKALIKTGNDAGVAMEIVHSADNVNDRQKLLAFEKLKVHFGGKLAGLKVAIWGLSFKPNTDDVREAPALYLIEAFNKAGAHVVAFDPVAGENALRASQNGFTLAQTALDCAKGADALIIATEWNEFRNPDFEFLLSALNKPVVFDGRNIWDPKSAQQFGFTYYCVGRQSLVSEGGL